MRKKFIVKRGSGAAAIALAVCLGMTTGSISAEAVEVGQYTLNDGPGGSQQGGSSGQSGSSDISWSGATEITSATTTSGQTYTSTTSGQNAVLINTSGAVTLTSPTVTKSGGTSAGDDESFYGINSAIMCKGGGTTTISGAKITTDAAGANGVFSYGGNATTNATSGDGTTVVISDSSITTTGNGSGGIMTTGQGITKASNLTVNTSGGSSAAIRSDRGGGTVTVDGGTYSTTGTGSPAVYATATITVNNATLNSTNSQGIVNEGGNTVVLNNCTVNAANATLGSQDNFKDGVFLYQSMSGDATEGASVFKMTDGSLNNTYGHVFHVTNTSAAITLSGVTIKNNDSAGVLLSVCDDAWSGLSNVATVNASNQTLDGLVLVGSDSTANINLSGTSAWTGATSGSITSHKNTSSISSSIGTVKVTMSDTASWTLSADSTISSISGTGTINYNGHTLTVGGTSYTSGCPGVSTIKDVNATTDEIAVGDTCTVSDQEYTVTAITTSSASGTVAFTGAKNAKKVTVPDTVTLSDGNTYLVTSVAAGAFTGSKIRTVVIGKNVQKLEKKALSGSKATKLILSTKKLTKKKVKGSLMNSKVSVVKVKVGNSKTNEKYVKKYTKIFTKKIAGAKVTVK